MKNIFYLLTMSMLLMSPIRDDFILLNHIIVINDMLYWQKYSYTEILFIHSLS